MFIITNRKLNVSGKGTKAFGQTPNEFGPNELRLVSVEKNGDNWTVNILPDKATEKMKTDAELNETGRVYFASDYVASILFKKLQAEKKNLLFFVHGYNNNMEEVLERANRLEQLYSVEVLAFSWPANGGGVWGTTSYMSDKKDARASTGALERALGRMSYLFREHVEKVKVEINKKVDKKLGNKISAEKRNELTMELQENNCTISVNMMVHSMGNYLYQYTLFPKSSEAHELLFDNVILVAADTNNEGHKDWVDKIPCRKSVYITLNEDDKALRWSRAKVGEEQLPRLGHYLHNLDSRQGVYINFTGIVGDSHAYFEGTPVEGPNNVVFNFFNKTFNGFSVYNDLLFNAGINSYRLK
ncbi:alpha/beta hydrolase [Raoultella terrigena]|jgi:esterase/lipase superfamily enzyme|uniref:alpha/beta hydrolase n=1 Tax=Raoultella terrigena TaxID=577 RepID=UPI000978396D|nr:alpha/beta hydrolase [Raoultella terrigena]OMP94770.1 hypothetical protein BZP36_09420 [Raoultella terrigena]